MKGPFLKLLGGQKKSELLEGGMVLDETEGRLVLADDIGAEALALAFFAKILFVQGIAALAKGFHDQLAFFHFSHEVIGLFLGKNFVFHFIRHGSCS
jgi:hypothetical protein